MTKKTPTIVNVAECLKKYFNIISVIPIVDYDCQLEKLYNVLAGIKKDKFDPQDRIIFIFDDTEYYYKNRYGFTLYNLQKILYDLDIPNYFCIILTHQSYIKQDSSAVCRDLGCDTNIDTFDLCIDHYYLDINTIPKIDFNFEKIEKPFIFLSRTTRKHRTALFSLLENDYLLDKGIISFSVNTNTTSNNNTEYSADLAYKSNIQFLTTKPFTRVNEDWKIQNQFVNTIFDNFVKSANKDFTFKNFNENVETTVNSSIIKNYSFTTQSGFLCVGAETVMSYPGTFITEKSFKGIFGKRPFVLLAPQGNLKKLKDYGFKTFNSWWDESYDNIEDPSERLLAVYKIIQYISEKSLNELIDLANDMKDVLQYNYDFLTNENGFSKSQFDRLEQQCVENLKPR